MQKTIIILLILLLLSGCSANVRQDGPPRMDVDVAQIPNAVPKVEPRSKRGNPSSYVVDGKRYHVLNSAAGYDKRGIASWYGTKFQHRLTSSGEPYNMFAMTAASTNLPIPTYAQVTNLENGRHVIVKVNDRGPFEKNRIIDLSYVAAKKLDMLKKGTALVEVKAINPLTFNQNQEDNNLPTLEHPGYPELFLQVGSFTHLANAEKLRRKVRYTTRQRAEIETVFVHHRPRYRVQIGPIKSVARSDQISTTLEQDGFGRPLVVIR